MSKIIKFFRGVYDFLSYWSQYHMFNQTREYARKVFASMSNKDQSKMYHTVTRTFHYLKSLTQLAFGLNYAIQAFAVLGAFTSWMFATAVHMFAAYSFFAMLTGEPSFMLSALIAPSLLYAVPVAAITLFGVYAFVITNAVDLFVSAAYVTTLAIGSASVATYGFVAGLVSHKNTSAPTVDSPEQDNQLVHVNLAEQTVKAKPTVVNNALLSKSPTITHVANNDQTQPLLAEVDAKQNMQNVLNTANGASNDSAHVALNTLRMV